VENIPVACYAGPPAEPRATLSGKVVNDDRQLSELAILRPLPTARPKAAAPQPDLRAEKNGETKPITSACFNGLAS
jgi:hypothetical protein